MTSSFSPSEISSLRLWLDSADSNTITLSGSNVTQWNDKSGGGRNAIVSSTRFATWSSPSTGVSFSNSYYTTTYTADPVDETMFIVLRSISPSNTIILSSPNPNGRFIGIPNAVITPVYSIGAGKDAVTWGPNIGMSSNAVQLATAQFSSSGSFSRISANGGVYSSYPAFTFNSGSNTNIGATFIGGVPALSYIGIIYELLFYNSVLSTNSVQQVEGYLAWKWNLVSLLPPSHLYKNSPPPSTILPSIVSTPTFTGIEYIRRPFSYKFSSTITEYPNTIQLTDSSPLLLSSVSGDTFASTTGFQGTPGPAGTLIADIIASNSPYVQLLAGSSTGNVDGIGSNARMSNVGSMEFDSNGNMIVADYTGLRTITPSGNSTRYLDLSTGVSGVVYDSMSNLFCTVGQAIYKILPNKTASLFAGDVSTSGFTDGTGASARFDTPLGLTIDLSTNTLYVADTGNSAIRQVTSAGVVTTVAGNGGAGGVFGFATRRDGFVTGNSPAVYVARSINNSNTCLTTNTRVNNNRFVNPSGVVSLARPQGLVYGGGRWVAVGAPNYRVSYSTNGLTWITGASTGIESNLKVDYGNSVYVAVGIKGAGTATAAYSTDPTSSWTDISTIPINGTTISNVRFFDGKFVAMGTDSSGTRAAYSTDGSNWIGISNFAGSTSGRDIAYNGSNTWVCIGNGGSIKRASNIAGPWSNITGMSIPDAFSIDFGNGFWTVGGSNGAGGSMVQYSSNLTTWTSVINGNGFSSISVVRYSPPQVYRPGFSGAWVFGEGREEDRFTDFATGRYSWIPSLNDPAGIRGVGSAGTSGSVNAIAFGEVTSLLLPPQFLFPQALVKGIDGLIYIAETLGSRIRTYNPITTEVNTFAGTGEENFGDGFRLDAFFDTPCGITQDPSGNIYVGDTYNYRIRKITGDTVTTYAGNGSLGDINGYASVATMEPRPLKYYNNRLYFVHDVIGTISNSDQVRYIIPAPTDVRPSGNRPSGYVIAASLPTSVNILSRLDVSTTAINNLFQLYKYEPFGGNTFSSVLSGDTLSFARSSGQVITSLTSNSNAITFASSNGYQSSFSNLQLIVDVLSNGIIVDSNSNTVNVGVGRFFPPISNTAYTLYKNEAFTPIRFSTILPVASPVSSPSLPPGLSFVQVNSNTYDLSGIPLIETPNSNYLIIGNGTGSNAGKTVTTTISIVVNGERINLDVSGTLNYTGLTQDVSLSPNTTITARYPAGGAIRYTWFPALLPGFTFTDSTGSQQTGNSIFPTDLSGSITLSGAPTANAIQILSASGSNSYSVNLRATRVTPSPNITATKTFTFDFSAAVFFNQVSTPILFAGIPVPSNSVYFGASTVLSLTDTSISDIFLVSGSLPDGLALTFSNVEARAYINGTPSSTSSPEFTLRASNTLGVTQDYTTTLTIINDTVTFTNPLVDACYNFIQFKPVSNATIGRYTYPIQFTASAASLCNVTMTTSDLNGTGLSLVPVGTNTYQISGTPTISKALTTLNVTATAAVSGATTINNKVQYSISGDVITLDPETITCIQNRPITPIQFSGTTLSGRPIVSFTSSNLPAGFALSSTGLLSGTHTGSVSGSFTVAASTGYSSASSNYSFTVTPDRIITIPLGGVTSYPLVPGDPYPSVQFKGISYSGVSPSNYTYVPLTGSIPNLGVNSTSGVLTGTVPGSLVGVSGTSSIQSSVGSVSGTGNLITVALNSNTIQFSIVVDPTITFSSPIASEYIVNQYVPIIPIQFSISSPGTAYFFADPSSLPRGIIFDPVTAQLQGTPSQVGEYIITVYVYVDGVGYSLTSITLSVIIPRIIRQQSSASAYTSMIRQYTLVNAAQNARGNRVLTEDGKQGEFMAPMGTDNLIPTNCFTCDPNSASNASNA